MSEAIRNTLNYLRKCQKAKDSGYPVAYVTDPSWLIDMAIARRMRWPEDPTHTRGCARPVNGQYPIRYSGDRYRHLLQLSYRINTPNLVVRENELGEWHDMLMKRIPDRFMKIGDF